MMIILAVPYLVWRLGKTEYYAPLVVVQIITGILLGPGVLGAIFPGYYHFVFNEQIIQTLNGIAWWAVMIFVWIAGIELDLKQAWQYKRESGITAGLALGVPLLFGCSAAAFIVRHPGWMGSQGQPWQFVLGIGMSCAVTALPILILFMEKLEILRQPIGQRILRYASVDDIAVWAVLAMILMDWFRVGRQIAFLVLFALLAFLFRKLMRTIPEKDRWYLGLVWLTVCAYGADWAGLHFMVGAFLAGAILDTQWFNTGQLDALRHNVLLIVMPVFFLSTGLRTNWDAGGAAVFIVAGLLLVAAVGGKLAGTALAGKILRWQPGEASLIGWLLQTKALIMIIFVNILLDKQLITGNAFTALLLMAVASTMLTIPLVTRKLNRSKALMTRAG